MARGYDWFLDRLLLKGEEITLIRSLRATIEDNQAEIERMKTMIQNAMNGWSESAGQATAATLTLEELRVWAVERGMTDEDWQAMVDRAATKGEMMWATTWMANLGPEERDAALGDAGC